MGVVLRHFPVHCQGRLSQQGTSLGHLACAEHSKWSQPALVLLVAQGRQNPCFCQRCTVSRKHLLPRHALLVQPILEKWGNDVAEFPLLQASVNPSRIVTEKAVPPNVTRATPGYY